MSLKEKKKLKRGKISTRVDSIGFYTRIGTSKNNHPAPARTIEELASLKSSPIISENPRGRVGVDSGAEEGDKG